MSGFPEIELWRERLFSRYGGTTLRDRVGFVLARSCDERGIVWISVRSLRIRLIAIWPELLEAPKRGRRASGISYDRLKRTLAAHPDWKSIGRVRYPDSRLGPAIRLLSEAVRREVGLPVSFSEAAKWHVEMTPGEAAWLSRFPRPKWHDTSNPEPKSHRNRQRTQELRRILPELDVVGDPEQLPAWLHLHSLEWEI